MSADPEVPKSPRPGSSFEAEWLSLREPVDHRSRADELLAPLGRAWRTREWRRIADLGAGAGSNLRYLAERIPGPQEWMLVDHDPSLLARATTPRDEVTVTHVVGDLSAEGIDALEGVDLVLGAALLDLTSEPWLRRVVDVCAEGGMGALFSTIYDGTVHWKRGAEGETPRDASAGDRRVLELVNAHQRRDKGFGGALGPDAARAAHRLFREADFDTWLVPTPWILDSRDTLLAGMLIDGWADAALEQGGEVAAWIDDWRRSRKEEVEAGQTCLTVGHLDLLALPRDA